MPINHLTVALDLTPMDEKILNYTQFICQNLPVKIIYFIHVTQKLDLPESHLKAHPEQAQSLDETLIAQMREMVEKILGTPDHLSFEYAVIEGKLLNSLVHHSKVKPTDLMVVGKWDEAPLHLSSEKLLHHSPCSVLFVPETYSLDIRHVLVPTDFSEYSRQALKAAIKISSAIHGDTIHVLNLFEVPLGHEKIGLTYEQSAAEMRRYAEEDMQKFMADLDLKGNNLATHVMDLDGHEKAHLIRDCLQKLDCQLLVIGSKGRSNLANLFMGSLTEKLIKLNLGVPLLVIKKKNESLGFFQALIDGQL